MISNILMIQCCVSSKKLSILKGLLQKNFATAPYTFSDITLRFLLQ